MAKRYTTEQGLESSKNTNFTSFKDTFVDLKPGTTGTTVKKLRLVGLPLGYREHSNRKKDENGKEVMVPFPDAEYNKSFTRTCTENDPAYGACPWCALNYKSRKMFSINVIDRDDSKVKVLNKGATIYNKFWEQEASHKELNTEDASNNLWTEIGSANAPDVRIKAEADATALGGVKYTISFNPKPTPLKDDEIEALAAIYKPTAEEREALIKSDQALSGQPDWYLYGYQLEKLHKPSLMKSAPRSTTAEDLTLSDEDAAAAPVAVGAGEPDPSW